MNPARDENEAMILGVCGALRLGSASHAVTAAVREIAGGKLEVFGQLRELPAFDESDSPAPSVAALRTSVAAASGVLLVTPEYAYGPPGVLKNALDWLVGSGELNEKPVAVVSVSSSAEGGARAQRQLLATLEALNARIVATLAVGAVRTRMDEGGCVTDPALLAELVKVAQALRGVDHQAACSSRTPPDAP